MWACSGVRRPSVKSIETIAPIWVLSLHVGCSSQYAQIIFEFLKKKKKKKKKTNKPFLRNFLIFVNIVPYGSENFKKLLLQF